MQTRYRDSSLIHPEFIAICQSDSGFIVVYEQGGRCYVFRAGTSEEADTDGFYTERAERGVDVPQFRNNPDHEDDINKLLYGEGDLTVDQSPLGTFAGYLRLGSDYELELRGSISYGLPFVVRFQGGRNDRQQSRGMGLRLHGLRGT